MDELLLERIIDLPAQSGDGDVDDVVEGRRARRHLPHVAGEHFSRHQAPLVAEEVLEDLELLGGQIEELRSPRHSPRDEIDLEIVVLKLQNLIHSTAAKERADS